VKNLRAALALPVAALAVLSTASPALAAPERARSIAWAPCAQDATADCGKLVLPIDWDNPNGGTFTLALARRKAKVPGERIGSLVFDPGGPGGPGVPLVIGDPNLFSQQLQDHFDIIGFDPRGVGDSQAIKCDTSVLETAPTGTADTPQGYAAFVAYNRKLLDDCRQVSGPLIDHVDDLSVVKDIDAIRAALGEQKLTYYGVSYGTLMGQQYAELFPNHVRALALDSNMDHSQDTTGFLATEAQTDEDAFHEFVKWCDSDAKCVLHGQDVNALFNQLYTKAQAGTLVDPDSQRTVTPDMLSDLPVGYLYGPDWAPLAQELSKLAGAKSFGPKADTQVQVYFPFAFCSDWKFNLPDAASVAAQRRIDNKIAPVLRVSGIGWGAAMDCLGVTKVANPQHRYHVHGTPPILIVGGQHDPATPYAWSVDAARQIPAATLLTYDGWGHGQYDKSPCVVNAVDSYLISQTMPAKGTHCPAVPPASGFGPQHSMVSHNGF
jgi:pimeloyl-ACP methyl ester carboxylesterase